MACQGNRSVVAAFHSTAFLMQLQAIAMLGGKGIAILIAMLFPKSLLYYCNSFCNTKPSAPSNKFPLLLLCTTFNVVNPEFKRCYFSLTPFRATEQKNEKILCEIKQHPCD